MSNILITGCAGFIGSTITKSILDSNSNYNVIGIDNFDNYYSEKLKKKNLLSLNQYSKFKFFKIDILDTQGLQKITKSIDVCIHLAAKPGVVNSVKFPNEYFHNNLTGTSNLLTFLKLKKTKKIIFASSSSVYESDKNNSFVEDKSKLSPLSPYGLSKLFCESYLDMFHNSHQFDVIKLRLFSVYGPKMRPDLAIFKFTDLIFKGSSVQIYGNGSSSRDYTYIEDVADAFKKALKYIIENKKVCETINIGNAKPISITELINCLSNKLNININKNYLPANKFELNTTFADINKAYKLIGYQPKIGLEEGLDNFVEWYKRSLT